MDVPAAWQGVLFLGVLFLGILFLGGVFLRLGFGGFIFRCRHLEAVRLFEVFCRDAVQGTAHEGPPQSGRLTATCHAAQGFVVVIPDPYGTGQVGRKAHEPGIMVSVSGPGFPGAGAFLWMRS